MPWTDWIPGPGWQTNEDVLTLGSLQERWATGPDAWIGMALSAVLASFFIVSLAYMIAYAFNHPTLRKWAKGEYYQVMASALLVVGLVAIVEFAVASMSAVTADIAYQTGQLEFSGGGSIDNPFYLAALFLDENIECLKAFYLIMYIADTFLEPISEFSLGIMGNDAVSLAIVLGPIISMIYLVVHNVVFLLLANYVQLHFLIFIFQTMFTVFLPIGIILRTLPVTRGFGGFMIAVAIGLYIVYPISYSALMLTTRQIDAGVCAMSIDAAELNGFTIGDVASFFYQKARGERFQPLIERDLGLFQNSFMFFAYRAFIFPLIALSLTFTFVRASAAFFGADIAEMGRGLIKLI